jgi:hypothetical protein
MIPELMIRMRIELMDWWLTGLYTNLPGITRGARIRTTEPEFVHSEARSGQALARR